MIYWYNEITDRTGITMDENKDLGDGWKQITYEEYMEKNNGRRDIQKQSE